MLRPDARVALREFWRAMQAYSELNEKQFPQVEKEGRLSVAASLGEALAASACS